MANCFSSLKLQNTKITKKGIFFVSRASEVNSHTVCQTSTDAGLRSWVGETEGATGAGWGRDRADKINLGFEEGIPTLGET